LVRAAIERAKNEGLTVLPWCLYARKWLQDHPDVESMFAIDGLPGSDHDQKLQIRGRLEVVSQQRVRSPSVRAPLQ